MMCPQFQFDLFLQMNYLREMMKDYKNEVKEMLSADKTLATEIQFDLRKWEEQEQARIQKQKEQEDYEMVS